MRTRWCVAVVAFLALAGCAARPEATSGGDQLVGDTDPTGGGFIAVPLGPTSSSTIVPAGADVSAVGNRIGMTLVEMAKGNPAMQQALRRLGAT